MAQHQRGKGNQGSVALGLQVQGGLRVYRLTIYTYTLVYICRVPKMRAFCRLADIYIYIRTYIAVQYIHVYIGSHI